MIPLIILFYFIKIEFYICIFIMLLRFLCWNKVMALATLNWERQDKGRSFVYYKILNGFVIWLLCLKSNIQLLNPGKLRNSTMFNRCGNSKHVNIFLYTSFEDHYKFPIFSHQRQHEALRKELCVICSITHHSIPMMMSFINKLYMCQIRFLT